MSRNGSLASAGEEKKKRVYRTWKVGDRCTVVGEGPGVIVLRYKKGNYRLTFHVKLDEDIRGSRTVSCGADKLALSPDEHRACVMCEKDFTARPGVKKVTCSWDCSEKYNREQTRERKRKR